MLFPDPSRAIVDQGVNEEELDAEEMRLEGALGDVANLTQVHEIVAQLSFGQSVG